jgi:hypothetical protein
MTVVARNLINQLDRFLGPAVPSWYGHDENQWAAFGSPEVLEASFAKRHGSEVASDYVAKLERCLQGLSDWIASENKMGETYTGECSVVFFEVVYPNDNTYINLRLIKVRPCASGLRILKVVLYVLWRHAKVKHLHLGVKIPLPKTQTELKRISGHFEQEGSFSCLLHSFLETVNFNLEDKIDVKRTLGTNALTVHLAPEKWPTVNEMNDLGELDKRHPIKGDEENRRRSIERPSLSPRGERHRLPQIQCFELQVDASSTVKPVYRPIVYRWASTWLNMYFDGRRYSLSGYRRVKIQLSDLLLCEWCITGIENDQLKFEMAFRGIGPRQQYHFFVLKPERDPFAFESSGHGNLQELDRVFAYISGTRSNQQRCKIINLDMYGNEFHFTDATFDKVENILGLLRDLNPKQMTVDIERIGYRRYRIDLT